MSGINLYPEMNKNIIDILRFGNESYSLYAAELIEQQQAELKAATKDRDQWRVAAEASRDVIQPKLRAEIEELKANLNKVMGMVELAVNDIPHICETCGIENRVNSDCYCNQNLNPNTYIHSSWEWQHQVKLNEMKGRVKE